MDVVVDGMQPAAADVPTARNPTGDCPKIAPFDAPMRLGWSLDE